VGEGLNSFFRRAIGVLFVSTTVKTLIAGALAALAATPALAADMLVKKAPPPPRAPAWSWTGFYADPDLPGSMNGAATRTI
jgi:hypothetical protein